MVPVICLFVLRSIPGLYPACCISQAPLLTSSCQVWSMAQAGCWTVEGEKPGDFFLCTSCSLAVCSLRSCPGPSHSQARSLCSVPTGRPHSWALGNTPTTSFRLGLTFPCILFQIPHNEIPSTELSGVDSVFLAGP